MIGTSSGGEWASQVMGIIRHLEYEAERESFYAKQSKTTATPTSTAKPPRRTTRPQRKPYPQGYVKPPGQPRPPSSIKPPGTPNPQRTTKPQSTRTRYQRPRITIKNWQRLRNLMGGHGHPPIRIETLHGGDQLYVAELIDTEKTIFDVVVPASNNTDFEDRHIDYGEIDEDEDSEAVDGRYNLLRPRATLGNHVLRNIFNSSNFYKHETGVAVAAAVFAPLSLYVLPRLLR